jgi:selenium binding protein SBP56
LLKTPVGRKEERQEGETNMTYFEGSVSRETLRAALIVAMIAILIAASGAVSGVHALHEGRTKKSADKVLYIWAGDQARVAPDFLAVIDFDEDSPTYGHVMRTLPLPAPGNVGNEPHHCHMSADEKVLACGGLLSLLRGQNGIFFFDVKNANKPRFMFSAGANESAIADDFLPLEKGGFLVTMMGSASGGAPGRLAEFDRQLNLVAEWPHQPPLDGSSLADFNPHGIDARPEINLLVTSDFINPVTTLNSFAGDVELRGAIRVWDMSSRTILRTIRLPVIAGSMDVKLIPNDPEAHAIVTNMFEGIAYSVDTRTGQVFQAFDCDDVVPHIDTPVPGGMLQILAVNSTGDRLLFGLFQTGQIGMLDISNPTSFSQVGPLVDLGLGAGPHDIVLTDDDKRLVVTDYFLNEDDFGKIHFEGDHKVHVIKVTPDALSLDTRFNLDFNTTFPTGPARPHGIAMK